MTKLRNTPIVLTKRIRPNLDHLAEESDDDH